MINTENLRITVVPALKKYTGAYLIRANQNAEPPPYPYSTYHITTYATQNNGTYGEYDDGKARKPVNQIYSFTTHSDNYEEAFTIANKMREWLDYVGTVYLSDNGIVVQSVGAVADRSNILTVDYQYSFGFDCTFSVFDEIGIPNNGEIDSFAFEEDAFAKLENRLDGVEEVAYGANKTTESDDELLAALEKRLSGEE